MSDVQLSDSKLTPDEQYLLAIADELENDPMGLGYKDSKPEEQAAMLNGVWYQTVQQAMTPRIASIIAGIPFTPNSTSPDEITKATTVAADLRAKVAAVK